MILQDYYNPNLILYGALICMLVLFGTDLLLRYFKADRQTRGDPAYLIFFVIGAGVIGDSLYTIPALIDYFFTPQDYLLSLQAVIPMGILTAFAVMAENVIIPKKFTFNLGRIRVGALGLGGLGFIIYGAISVFKELFDSDNTWSGYPLLPVYVALAVYGLFSFLIIIDIFFIRLRPQKEIKRKIAGAVLFGVFTISGVGLRSIFDVGVHDLLYTIGTVIEISGWFAMRWALLSVPSYSEIEWRGGLIEMHVILAESGISLFYRKFRGMNPSTLKGDWKVSMTIPEADAPRPDTDLISGGMIGIKSMLGEIAGTKGKLQHIQIGEKHLIFHQGSAVLVLLLAERQLGVYHSILQNLVREIEQSHSNLQNFGGDTRTLHIEAIVDKNFGKTEHATSLTKNTN